MKVKVVASNDKLRDIGLGGLITSGQVLEVTGEYFEIDGSVTHKCYEFSVNVLGLSIVSGFGIYENMVEVL